MHQSLPSMLLITIINIINADSCITLKEIMTLNAAINAINGFHYIQTKLQNKLYV